MAVFTLIQKKDSVKLESTVYRFSCPNYDTTVQVMDGEILYPITLKGIGQDIDIQPDIRFLSKTGIEIVMPPSIMLGRLSRFCDKLTEISDMIKEFQIILNRIEQKCVHSRDFSH